MSDFERAKVEILGEGVEASPECECVLERIWELAGELPMSVARMTRETRRPSGPHRQDDRALARAFAAGLVSRRRHLFHDRVPREIFEVGVEWIPRDVLVSIARRHAKHPVHGPRARAMARRMMPGDVALPKDDADYWDYTGWSRGVGKQTLFRHQMGLRPQKAAGVPPIANIRALRELLGIRSYVQLGYFLLASDRGPLRPYHTFTIPKRSGEDRLIAAPTGQLREVQRAIQREILSKVPVHERAHGYVPGRSTLTNAQPHVGKALLLKFDLSDFFPTIAYWRVVGLFASLGYPVGRRHFSNQDWSTEVAPTLARLCCYTPDPQRSAIGYTPQGAPTSPTISNLVCRRLDARLDGLARALGGDYTRYADDLTFSFDVEPHEGVGRLKWWVNQICHQEGFHVREDKFRLVRASQQQRVTGIVVNDRMSVPRKERRRFRAIVHNCERHGVESQRRGRDDFESWMLGYASYMRMVHPEEGGALLERVKALLSGA